MIVRLLDILFRSADNKAMEISAFNEKIGERIRDLRKAKGLTQDKFAIIAGLSRGTIANIETGRQAASGHQLFHLAAILGAVTMDDIFPMLPAEDEADSSELPIHRGPDLSDAQYAQIQAAARSVR